MDRFIDPDIESPREALGIMDRYEWTISDQDRGSLNKWTTVTNIVQIDEQQVWGTHILLLYRFIILFLNSLKTLVLRFKTNYEVHENSPFPDVNTLFSMAFKNIVNI